MGFIYFAAVMGSFLVIAAPGGVLAILLGRQARRRPAFWIAAAGALAVGLVLRLYLGLEPHLSTAEIPIWPGRFGLILGIPLFATVLVSASGLFAASLRTSPLRESLLGAAAGLGASLPVQVVLATVWFSELAGLLGLRVTY